MNSMTTLLDIVLVLGFLCAQAFYSDVFTWQRRRKYRWNEQTIGHGSVTVVWTRKQCQGVSMRSTRDRIDVIKKTPVFVLLWPKTSAMNTVPQNQRWFNQSLMWERQDSFWAEQSTYVSRLKNRTQEHDSKVQGNQKGLFKHKKIAKKQSTT